jgi:hypothetical protein
MATKCLGIAMLHVGALLSPAASLTAQDSASVAHHAPTATEPALHCWRGRPAPTCRTFVITEIGYYSSLLSTSVTEPITPGFPTTQRRKEAFTDHATFEIGVMQNHGPSSALGATLFIGGDGHGGRFGARARYRRWLSADGRSLDVSTGIIAASLPRTSRTAILTSDVALNFSDYGAIVAGVDLARTSGRPRAALSGGARLGSKPGLIATGLTVLVGLALVLALTSLYGAE